MRYLLDTNVIVYAAGRSHPYRVPCERVLRAVYDGSLSACVDSELLQELLYRYARIGEASRGRDLALEVLVLVPEVLPIGAAEIRRAIELGVKYPGLSPRDLIHAAVALEHGIAEIISTNRDFDQIAELRRIHPKDVAIPDRLETGGEQDQIP